MHCNHGCVGSPNTILISCEQSTSRVCVHVFVEYVGRLQQGMMTPTSNSWNIVTFSPDTTLSSPLGKKQTGDTWGRAARLARD